MQDWKKANSNLSWIQAGSEGAKIAALVTGAVDGFPTKFDYDDVRRALMTGSVDHIAVFDDFLGAALSSKWSSTVSTGGTVAVSAAREGKVALTLDNTDDDFANLTLGLHWRPSNGPLFFEARVSSPSAITLRAIEIGLSDALTESNGLAFSNHSAAGVTAVADNAVIFGYDTDASMSRWAVNTVKAAGTPQAEALMVAPGTSYNTYAIIVDVNGTARFYFDGALVSTIENAVATSALLTPWLALKNLSGAARSIEVDYVFVGSSR